MWKKFYPNSFTDATLALFLQDEPRSAPVTPKPEVKDVKDIKPATPSSQPKPPAQKKVFTADELRQAFAPLVEKLLKTEESVPFRQPVDAQALNIPVSCHLMLLFSICNDCAIGYDQ